MYGHKMRQWILQQIPSRGFAVTLYSGRTVYHWVRIACYPSLICPFFNRWKRSTTGKGSESIACNETTYVLTLWQSEKDCVSTCNCTQLIISRNDMMRHANGYKPYSQRIISLLNFSGDLLTSILSWSILLSVLLCTCKRQCALIYFDQLIRISNWWSPVWCFANWYEQRHDQGKHVRTYHKRRHLQTFKLHGSERLFKSSNVRWTSKILV